MEAEFEHASRVAAPVALVWEELESLAGVLRLFPGVVEIQSVDPDQIRIVARFAWGPVKWNLEGTAVTRLRVPYERLGVSVRFPGMGLTYEGDIELAGVAATETNVLYRGTLRCGHPLVSRLGGFLHDLAEDHVRSLVNKVKGLAERRHLAEQRLLRRARQQER